jgi:hypothetical protein
VKRQSGAKEDWKKGMRYKISVSTRVEPRVHKLSSLGMEIMPMGLRAFIYFNVKGAFNK